MLDLERDCGNVGNSLEEFAEEISGLDVEDLGFVDAAVVVNLIENAM